VSRSYRRQEAEEILRRALAGQAEDGFSHDELVAAAREVGISSQAIEAAAADLDERRVVEAKVADLRRRKRRAFVRHLLTYALVMTAVFLFDRLDGGAWFFHYPAAAWGIAVILIGIRQLAPDPEQLSRRARREAEKERRRAAKRLERAERGAGGAELSGATKAFEAAVDEGVAAVLSAATRALRRFVPDEERYRVNTPPEDESAPARNTPADATMSGARRRSSER
jgi:hypothetical protein